MGWRRVHKFLLTYSYVVRRMRVGLRLGCIFPFVTSIQFDEVGRSTLGHAQEHLDLREVFHLLRYFFFVGRDPKSLQSFVLDKVRAHQNDEYRRRITNVLGLLSSSNEL
jgi:hypothetical protein